MTYRFPFWVRLSFATLSGWDVRRNSHSPNSVMLSHQPKVVGLFDRAPSLPRIVNHQAHPHMIFTSLNLNADGKQHGYLQVPYSHNLGGWANVMIPMTIIANGQGPTVLVMGGNHGDEYQGQIAARKLARELTPDMINGRLILIPSLNFPAARAATRLSPLDGMNLNRAFPGHPEGSVTSQIAHYLTTVLFPLSDVVIDIHSGGRSMEFVPCSHMHLVPDKEQRKKMLAAMLAWNTDFSFLYADIAGSGLLPSRQRIKAKSW